MNNTSNYSATMKRVFLYCCCMGILLSMFPSPLHADDLSSILVKADNPYRGISREDAELLMSTQQDKVLKAIRKTSGNMDCKGAKNVLSQYAIAYIGLFGEQRDTSIIKHVWDCDKSHAKDLLPCEYYCTYEFALDLHDIRFNNKAMPQPDINNWPTFSNRFTSTLRVDSLGDILAQMTEEDLVRSIYDKELRPALPVQIIEGMSASQVEHIYRFSAYYQLAKVAENEKTKNELFKELLFLYFRDASGDGGVRTLQQTILMIESR